MVKTIKNSYFGEVEQSRAAVLDFSATWCGPCKMLAPIFHELAEEVPEVDFYSVDVDENMDLAQRFGVSAVPTLVFLKNGTETARSMGVQGKDTLCAWIKENE